MSFLNLRDSVRIVTGLACELAASRSSPARDITYILYQDPALKPVNVALHVPLEKNRALLELYIALTE